MRKLPQHQADIADSVNSIAGDDSVIDIHHTTNGNYQQQEDGTGNAEHVPLLLEASEGDNSEDDGQMKESQITAPSSSRKRIIALDIMRGATVIMMIVANNQAGSAYPPLRHAAWNGLTPTDLVFPFFLWIVGYAVGIVFRNEWSEFPSMRQLCLDPAGSIRAYREKVASGNDRKYGDERVKLFYLIPMKRVRYEQIAVWIKIFRRSALLFAIGFGMSLTSALLGGFVDRVRIFGVMQRIAWCYFATSVLAVLMPYVSLQVCVVILMQIVYIVIMFGLHVPNCGRGVITPACNAAGYIDRMLLGRHVYRQGPFDPEGPVSNLSAVTNTFAGLLFYKVAERAKGDEYKRLAHWMLLGTALVLSGLFIHWLGFEINKSIWSTSFALVTAGLAGITLSIISFLVDTLQWNKYWPAPFLWVGSNPLLLYIVPTVVVILMINIYVTSNRTLYSAAFQTLFASWVPDPRMASLLWSLFYEMCFIPGAWFLYWRKIYVKL